LVGLPPLTQAFADEVPWPSPNILSRNGHRNTQPMQSLVIAQRYLTAVSRVKERVAALVVGAVTIGAALPIGVAGASGVVLI
jgi:hypothetical protein